MTEYENWRVVLENLQERYELIKEKLIEIQQGDRLHGILRSYFADVSAFVIELTNIMDDSLEEKCTCDLDKLKERNRRLYEDILPENYPKSFANPEYITSVFEKDNIKDSSETARILSFLYVELRGLIPYAVEARLEIFVIYCELFIQIYTMYCLEDENEYPAAKFLKENIYYFESDNCDIVIPDRLQDQLDPQRDFATKIVLEEDLNNISYLYKYGEYISDDEIASSRFLAKLSDEEIGLIADTYTEGYRIGFVKAGKPLHKKKTVNIRYTIGFERVIRKACANFKAMGLEPVIYRCGTLSLNRRGLAKIGYVGGNPNKQYDFDHKDDEALFIDADFVTRKMEVYKETYESMKSLANTHAGPAVMETFGEEPFTPVAKDSAIKHTDKTRKYALDLSSKLTMLTNEYIIGDERSFTIIAFPVASIGSDYEKIFRDTLKVNTLDYKLYEEMQQKIIDCLDKAKTVHVLGKGDNKTDLYINLATLSCSEKETKFENCVADVNIPVGEVFTSPVLKGTNGVLHVTGVYLNELFFDNLYLEIVDGCIRSYSVKNFENEEDNLKFVKDNLLYNHDTLPMGEFAIGTNTYAYQMARNYNINDKLPILIGEKTGPHFAFGDTCYSHEEDVKVYNPDGKEIIARENEISAKRKSDPRNAYFSCHTDVTIPYDELLSIEAIGENGGVFIFKDGGFSLDGLEELNKPLKQ